MIAFFQTLPKINEIASLGATIFTDRVLDAQALLRRPCDHDSRDLGSTPTLVVVVLPDPF